jgi:hypothetical protein
MRVDDDIAMKEENPLHVAGTGFCEGENAF